MSFMYEMKCVYPHLPFQISLYPPTKLTLANFMSLLPSYNQLTPISAALM